MSLLIRTGAISVALFLTVGLMAPQTARADAATDASRTSASTWIVDAWKNKRNQFFDAGTTADGIIALSAANQKPDTVRDMLLDLKKRGPSYSADNPAGLAKMVMTADIAGQNPRTLFGCESDPVKDLQALIATNAGRAKAKEDWGPSLIAIALSRANEQVPAWVIDELIKNQKGGGFGYGAGGVVVPDSDYTALGISAMNLVAQNQKNASDKTRAAASLGAALVWAADARNQREDPNGDYWVTYSSSNSTGMLASALGETGTDIVSPQKYLVSQQNADGGWAAAHQEPGQTRKSDAMATTQGILGVIGKGYGTARSTQVPEMVKCGTTTVPATVYNSPGDRVVNGRKWRTTCEAYSTTTRCRANIWAKTVSQVNGRFVVSEGYAFNNLTYLPSPRSQWKNNPLGAYGKVNGKETWTAGGRTWRTECDTNLTGRGGCRSFAEASVIETITRPGQPTQYRWTTKEIFNSMVQFS